MMRFKRGKFFRGLSLLLCYLFLWSSITGCSGSGTDEPVPPPPVPVVEYNGNPESVAQADTDESGKATIQSESLQVEYDITVVDQNGDPVPEISIDYAEVGNLSLIHVFDPSGQYTNAFIFGTPQEILDWQARQGRSANVKGKGEDIKREGDSFLLVGLIITIGLIAYAEFKIMTNVYKIGTFYVSDTAASGEGWVLYCKTWEEIAELLKVRFETAIEGISILINFVFAGGDWIIEVLEGLIPEVGFYLTDKIVGWACEAWQVSRSEIEGNTVAVKLYPVEEEAFASNLRQLFIPIDIIKDHPICNPAEGSLSGTVIDAVTGDPVPAATVEIFSNIDNTQPCPAAVTGSDGRYSFADLASGNYRLVATKNGYDTDEKYVSLSEGGQEVVNFVLSTLLAEDSYRIVLEWVENPRDLDAHLWTPGINGSSYHIYYSYKGSETQVPFVSLDLDDTTGWGPETITISRTYPGNYTYAVGKFAGSGSLAMDSQAVVKLYGESGLLATWTVPESGSGNWWTVFTLDAEDGDITTVDVISNSPPF